MHHLRRYAAWDIAGVLVISAVILLVLAARNKDAQVYVPILISLVSLAVALVSAFRGALFPFQLTVVPGGLCTVRHSDISSERKEAFPNDLDLVLPIGFLNEGYGEGIIEGLAVKVFEDSGAIMLYRPTVEVDLKVFVQGPSVPSKANIIGIFMPFPLHSKQSVQRVWLFSQDTRENPYPRIGWHPGRYRLEYFVKEGRWAGPRKVAAMEQVVDEAHLNAVSRGVAVVLPMRSITP